MKENESFTSVPIAGIQKLSMVDFEGKLCTTIFTQGCMFTCPFCHNSELISNSNISNVSEDEILDFLQKRKNILEAVCISGGEPLMHKNLDLFIKKIKDIGYLIKLDTNGSNPERLKNLVESGLVDYVAMDVKHVFDKYDCASGCPNIDINKIQESISWLLEDHVDYELRTTIVKPIHKMKDIIEISKYLQGCKRYYLQNFVDNENIIVKGLDSFTDLELKVILEHVHEYIPNAKIRGKNFKKDNLFL